MESRIIGSGFRIWRLNFLSITFKLGCCGSKICVADKLWPIRGLHFTSRPAKHLLLLLLRAEHLQLKSNAPSYYPWATWLASSGNMYLSLLPVISMNYLHVDLVQECPKLRLCPLVYTIDPFWITPFWIWDNANQDGQSRIVKNPMRNIQKILVVT